MNRRTASVLTTGVALALAASLSACGGDDSGSKKDEGVKGAEPTRSSAEPSPSPSRSEKAAERPKIELPEDLKIAFDWPGTGDTKKDAVYKDTEEFIKSLQMAVTRQKPTDPGFRFYASGEAAANAQAYVQRFVDTNDRVTGSMRYTKPNLKLNDDGTAGFVYCEDQSKAYRKSVKTGKTKLTQGSKDDYVLYNARLRLNNQGVWVTEKLISDAGSALCQP
ncbi:hypothetical protein [Streptomyces sp. NRRL F-5630]|uniref:hypothetical protein n=1 Tax=Streptomyces sp. NRRL F-5630 TaxID=1463864 RepID=UPI000A64238A